MQKSPPPSLTGERPRRKDVAVEEAVAMAVDIRAEHSIGVHWGTFQLTYEPFLSPPKRMAVERDRLGLPRDSFVAMHHGETRSWLLR